ncbi:MAG: phosphate ABC transporter substrate-binding protein [Methanoregulaceae archaeon]
MSANHSKITIAMLATALVLIGALLVAGCTGSGGSATPTPTAAPTTSPTTLTTTAPATIAGTPVTTAASAVTTTTTGSSYVPGTSSGKISVTGSTTVLPIAQKLAERFMELNKNADVQISGGGSGVGVQSAGEKTAEIGMSSRELKDAEKTKFGSLKAIPMASDGIVMIVHPTNDVTKLSVEQIKSIYTGKTVNWKDVGAKAQPIVVIGRDSASGTREFFTEKVMGKDATTKAMLEKNSNGAIQSSIGPNPGAIGYVGLGYVDATVKPLSLTVNGTDVEPTIENVIKGTYPLARNLYYVTNGDATGLAKDFIDFTLSPEGQKIVEEEGFVSITRTV